MDTHHGGEALKHQPILVDQGRDVHTLGVSPQAQTKDPK